MHQKKELQVSFPHLLTKVRLVCSSELKVKSEPVEVGRRHVMLGPWGRHRFGLCVLLSSVLFLFFLLREFRITVQRLALPYDEFRAPSGINSFVSLAALWAVPGAIILGLLGIAAD